MSAKDTGEMRAAHIVVDNEALAEVLLTKAKAGADFSLLARTHSKDPSGSDGGDLGPFKPGDLIPAFAQLVQSLAPGDVGGPLKTPRGFHVIKRIY